MTTAERLPCRTDSREVTSEGTDRTLRCATEFYASALQRSEAALAFLARYGLGVRELIDRFGLGFSDRSLGRALPALAAAEGETGPALRRALGRLGLLRASGHEHFAGCIVVPLVDAGGGIRQCYGRRIAGPRRAATPPRSLPGIGPCIWNESAVADRGDLILCDDVFDALTFWSVGHRRVLALTEPGGAAATALVLELLQRGGVTRVQLAFGANSAGIRTAEALASGLCAAGVDAVRLPLPRGYDVRTFARLHAPARESLGGLICGLLPAADVASRSGASSRSSGQSAEAARLVDVPTALEADVAAHLASLVADGLAGSTVSARRAQLRRMSAAFTMHGVLRTADVTTGAVEQIRVMLPQPAAEGGREPGWSTQANIITAVRRFFAWAVRSSRLATDPTVGLERPRLPRRLPRAVLSASEAERVLARPDSSTRLGLRDRAILEVLYSTGIRRMELIGLDLPDLDIERGVLFIREGKGRKDRLVPIGDRAIHWTLRYLDETRSTLLRARDPGALFLGSRGARMRPTRLTERLHGYVMAAGLGKSGSCHIFRHTMATLMHDGGADIRDLQEMLGHALLTTTQVYTHVSIARLKAVHTQTHPARFSR